MKQNNPAERRRYPRIDKRLPIKIIDGDFDIVTETKNISCIGAYCQVDKYIPLLTKVNAAILLPCMKNNNPQHINCKGVVVRVEKIDNTLENQYNIAIYFNEINKASLLKLNNFVKLQASK